MIAVQGYFDGDRFISSDSTLIPSRKRAIVTILDETVVPKIEKEKKAWKKFLAALASSDEELIGEPERVNFNRNA